MANLKINLGLAITVAVSDVADVFIPCFFSFISQLMYKSYLYGNPVEDLVNGRTSEDIESFLQLD